MSRGLDELFASQPDWLTAKEAADLMQKDPRTVYRWIADRILPAYKMGKEWMILSSDLKDTLIKVSNQAEDITEEDED